MKKFIMLCAAASCALASTAQSMNLDQCIDYAIEHNLDVRGRRISAYQSELEVTEAKDRFLPNLSGYASQSFNFGRGLTSDNTYANRNTSSFSLGAQLSLPIFQGLRAIRQLKYSKTALSAAKESTEAAKDNVTLNVITQYLQALYTREMLVVAQQSLDVSRGELARRRELLEAGKIAELDIYEASAQVSSDELRVVNARNDSTIAMLDLAQLLNYPADAPFDIEPLGENELPILSPETVYANALANNHTIRASRLSVDAAEQSVSVARSGYIPTLSFNAGLGSNYYKTSGFNNESFGQQMRHNFSQSLGFSLSVPIFDGFSTRNSVRRARVQAVSAALQRAPRTGTAPQRRPRTRPGTQPAL